MSMILDAAVLLLITLVTFFYAKKGTVFPIPLLILI